jgi:uncharacterized membrane protein YeaQ/YmgE (transglycosylase-associated protein family)
MLAYLLALVLSGLLVGALARLSLPGPDPLSLTQTFALGLAGSLIGGLIVDQMTDARYAAGLPVSVGCSSVILYVVRRRRGGGLVDPGTRR